MKTKEKKASIRAKLSLLVVGMLVIIMTAMSLLSCVTINNIIKTNSESELLTEADYFDAEIEGWANGILKEGNTILQTVKETGMAADSQTLLKYLEKVTLKLDEDMPGGVYAGTEKGEYLDPTGWVPDESFKVKERSWFIEGKNNETMTFGAPYYGENMKSNMVSASAFVDDNTILAIDVKLESIEKVVNEMKIAGDGYGFLVDANSGFMVAHKNQEYTGKLIQDIDDEIVQEAFKNLDKNGEMISFHNGDGKYYLTFTHVEETNWVLVTCADKQVLFQTVRNTIGMLIAISAFGIILVGAVIYLSVKKIMAPLEGLTEVIQEMTSGNLTVQPVVKGNGEMRVISEAVDGFIQNNRRDIKELTTVSQLLLEESDGSKKISDEMNEASLSQTEAMRQLNETVEELARSIEEIANSATELASTVTDVSKQGTDAKSMIEDTVQATNDGKEAISQVSHKMNAIDKTMKDLEIVVKEVGDSSDEINSITTLIGSIAGQTNLLALNASIEAARAGDAGKGFAVVASEIGNLAASSTDAVKQIEMLITKVCDQVQEVVAKTAQSVQDIRESKGLVDSTSATFMDIYKKVNTTADSLAVVVKKVQDVDNVASNMAAITEEQSAGTEEILATSESVYNQSVAITKSSEALRNSADQLNVSAERIKEFTEKYTV